MKKIKKAIITAAGLGTRMLPISYAVPKEMLPIVDRPALHFLVEEAAKSGITDILVITARGKESIEDFFDFSTEYDTALRKQGKTEIADSLREIATMANVYFLRQHEPKGLGHAVACARNFVGDEPFAVLYGDDVIFSDVPVVKQLTDVYEKYGKAVVGVKEVPTADISKYSSLKTENIEGESRVSFCTDMIEKPKPGEEFSNLSILGRVVLTPEIFDIIDSLPAGAGGEIQLTDAMARLARDGGIYALEFEGERFDLGSKLGFLKANIKAGLSHPETADELREFIKETAKDLL